MELRYLRRSVPLHPGSDFGSYKNILQFRENATAFWQDVPIVEEE